MLLVLVCLFFLTYGHCCVFYTATAICVVGYDRFISYGNRVLSELTVSYESHVPLTYLINYIKYIHTHTLCSCKENISQINLIPSFTQHNLQ